MQAANPGNPIDKLEELFAQTTIPAELSDANAFVVVKRVRTRSTCTVHIYLPAPQRESLAAQVPAIIDEIEKETKTDGV